MKSWTNKLFDAGQILASTMALLTCSFQTYSSERPKMCRKHDSEFVTCPNSDVIDHQSSQFFRYQSEIFILISDVKIGHSQEFRKVT